MYTLEYLPVARQDMIEIVRYIGQELKNPMAAERLAAELIEAGNRLAAFPYAYPVYTPIRPLRHELRKMPVQNYLLFYWVEEERKRITVARVIYAKRAYEQILE